MIFNLAKQGLTVSEYIRLSLVKAANNEVRLVSFLDSPEALAAKKEVETGQVKNIGSLTDFEDWIDKLDAKRAQIIQMMNQFFTFLPKRLVSLLTAS